MKIIPIEKALELTRNISIEDGLEQKEENIFNLILASINPIDIDGKKFVKLNDLQNFILNFSNAIKHKDFNWLTMRRGLCVDRIVDIEEFVKSSQYLKCTKDLRPAILAELIKFWGNEEYIEAVLTGGTAIGKTFFSQISLAYMLYRLSCYYNPQIEFGLASGSSIIFIAQSKTEKLAKKVIFEQFVQYLKDSSYFCKYFQFDPKVKSELRFPKNIYLMPVGGTDTAALGMNVWAGIIDELNFMSRVEDSTHVKYTGEDEYDQAEKVYTTLLRRIKGRFIQKNGRIPGRLILLSSRNYPGDFTGRKIEEVEEEIEKKGKTSTFVMNMAQWESIPEEKYDGAKFLVEVGDEAHRSKIIETREEATNPEKVIEIPIEYKSDFERDIDGALKDIGGIVVGTSCPFIPYKEQLVEAVHKHKVLHNNKSLFNRHIIFLSTLDSINQDWEQIVNIDYIKNDLIQFSDIFACHIDVGLNKKNGDAAGLSIGRILGYKVLPSFKYYSEKTKEFVEIKDMRAPIYHIDGSIQIRSKIGDEIDLNLVKDLILFIHEKIKLKWATFDTYQSTMLIQALRRAGIRAGVLSIDTSNAPYEEYKLAIKDERIYLPDNPILQTETKELERTEKKIDHRKDGSKDVSDSVAGVVFILQHKEAQYNKPRKRRRSSEELQRNVRKIRVGRLVK